VGAADNAGQSGERCREDDVKNWPSAYDCQEWLANRIMLHEWKHSVWLTMTLKTGTRIPEGDHDRAE